MQDFFKKKKKKALVSFENTTLVITALFAFYDNGFATVEIRLTIGLSHIIEALSVAFKTCIQFTILFWAGFWC